MPPQTTRIFTTNWAHGATLMNGTGGAPARDEDPDWPMERALEHGRGTPWITAAPAADPVEFDLGLGALRSIHAAGLLGYIGPSSGISFPNRVWLQYSANATYPPPSWTFFPVSDLLLNGSPRDPGTTFSPVNARWVRFWFENTFGNQFGVGHFFLGGAPADMGRAYSRGAERQYLHERQNNPTMDRTPVKTTVGRDHVDETFQFMCDNTDLTKALAAFTDHPFVMFTPFGAMKEMDVREGGVRTVHTHGDQADDRWQVTLDLEHLG